VSSRLTISVWTERKLGENWFIYEAVAFWMLAAAALAVIRFFARKHLAGAQAQ